VVPSSPDLDVELAAERTLESADGLRVLIRGEPDGGNGSIRAPSKVEWRRKVLKHRRIRGILPLSR